MWYRLGGSVVFWDKIPEYYTNTYRDIEGVFGAELRDLEAILAGFDYGFLYPKNFISEDKGIFGFGVYAKIQ